MSRGESFSPKPQAKGVTRRSAVGGAMMTALTGSVHGPAGRRADGSVPTRRPRIDTGETAQLHFRMPEVPGKSGQAAELFVSIEHETGTWGEKFQVPLP